MNKNRLACAVGAIVLAIAGSSSAGEFATLKDAVRNTVLTNPEVLSSYHEFTAAQQETRVARGGYFPRVDVEAGVGEERIDDPRFSENTFNRDRVSVTLSQMLFDGFATRNEVRRLNHAARTRYYEVMDASEQAAAETARAYYDVLRHRDLTRLSEENYATHRMIYDQIERRVRAGVSRRVDLEQAVGRLALSESNLLTDVTNLHDVSMRYQRIVGELPVETLQEPMVTPNLLPQTIRETLQGAYQRSPLMNAAIANLWSADAATDVAKAAFVPRFDLQAREDVWHDREDIDGRYEDGVIELVMRYNLYNGGSDLATRRRAAELGYQAIDIRDKTCRDIRQNVSISWNNTRRLEEQLVYLDRHQLSIDKAREAYRRQFDIGQRTLLDMLDTENEYFEARRAWMNADRDHKIAYAQTLAGMGGLLAALELGGSDVHQMEIPPGYDETPPDMYAICPQEGSAVPAIDKEQVFREAMEKQGHMTPKRPPAEGPLPYTKGGKFEQPPAEAAPVQQPAEEQPKPPKW